MEKGKVLLVITPGRKSRKKNCVFHILVAETGEHLASHFSTDPVFAYGDLYLTRENRIKEWKERFGDFEVKYIDETDLKEEELRERNKKWADSLPKKVVKEI